MQSHSTTTFSSYENSMQRRARCYAGSRASRTSPRTFNFCTHRAKPSGPREWGSKGGDPLPNHLADRPFSGALPTSDSSSPGDGKRSQVAIVAKQNECPGPMMQPAEAEFMGQGLEFAEVKDRGRHHSCPSPCWHASIARSYGEGPL